MNDQISDEEWNFNTVRSSCTLIKEDSILYQICQNMLAPQDIHTRLLKKLFGMLKFEIDYHYIYNYLICVSMLNFYTCNNVKMSKKFKNCRYD